MDISTLRTRWAAIGAAVAVSMGAGGIGISQAVTDSGDKPVYVPVEPCRLADIRPDTIGPNGTMTFDGWGATGACALPAGTAGLALNVTAVNATQQTNLRFYPGGGAVPETANLNPSPGAPPTPNAVNVTLNDADGTFSVFNKFGNVSVVLDVMGYYDDHHHDDRYYTESEIDARLNVVTEADGCDGIRAAIDGLPAHGGEVVLGAGTFECVVPVVIDRDNVTLRGAGSASTLVLADGSNAPLLVVGDASDTPTVVHHHVRVADLRLDGNSATQPDECWGGPCGGLGSRPIRNNTLTIRKATDIVVENVVATDARSGGLVIELDSRRITVRGLESYGHVFDGLAAYLTEDSTFTDLTLHDNTAAGLSFDTDFDNNLVSGVVITGSGTTGIFMRDSHDNLFTDIQIRDSTEHGVFIAQDGTDTSTAAIGNTFGGLLVEGSGLDGIHIANPANVDNLFDDIQFVGNAGGCLVTTAPVVLGENICR